MKAFLIVLVLIATLFAPTAAAEAAPHVYYVPAVASSGGLNGSFWVSEVRVFNPGTATANVKAYFLSNGDNSGAAPVAFTVAPRSAVAFEDVLSSLFAMSGGAGAMRLESDQPIAATSNLYTQATLCADGSGTMGQFVPAVPRSKASTKLRLDHFRSTTQYRGNTGFVNTSDSAANLYITLYDLSLNELAGEGILRIPPHGWAQLNGLTEQMFLFSDIDMAMIEVTSDVPVIAYASVVDNRTNDAFTVIGQPVE